ncbi:hypothetical protein BR93DRAFT_449581 [Coniochaeta sp. PMI_546]|nr:hypothetical protein BR93DRAFT_449581 [Coniochaeta sp. PMI_546]
MPPPAFRSTFSRMATPQLISPATLARFTKAQSSVYGPLPSPLTPQTAQTWSPPTSPGAGGHRGRYLWTDAFGVLNFLTLAGTGTSEPPDRRKEAYLVLAGRLAETVHDVLGRTRDGVSRLPGATDGAPLAGGLRIGKVEEAGPDGDGMYHHYATLWMFALDRLGLATGEGRWAELAVQLGRASSRSFVRREGGRLRMVWKVGVDGRTVLVPSEGHLDAATGFVVYRLVQRGAERFGVGERVLEREIEEYRELMGREGRMAASRDALDLGMGLWMCHFFRGEDWAVRLGEESLRRVPAVLKGVMARGAERRLAFREFGTCLGVGCWGGGDEEVEAAVHEILTFWEKHMEASTDEDLRPISYVMYAAALIPGGEYRCSLTQR